MKFIFLFILILSLSTIVYAEENTVPTAPNIMEVILFLSVNQDDNGAGFKVDHGKKMITYFDEEGRVIEESYLDEHNNIISKKYDQEGKIISEMKITEASVMAAKNQIQISATFSKPEEPLEKKTTPIGISQNQNTSSEKQSNNSSVNSFIDQLRKK